MTYKITRVDMHTGKRPSKPWEFPIDRDSVLGNPFRMKHPSDRDLVCNAYDRYFKEQIIIGNYLFKTTLRLMIKEYHTHGRLTLFCWCAPDERCHGETIINYLKGILNET